MFYCLSLHWSSVWEDHMKLYTILRNTAMSILFFTATICSMGSCLLVGCSTWCAEEFSGICVGILQRDEMPDYLISYKYLYDGDDDFI